MSAAIAQLVEATAAGQLAAQKFIQRLRDDEAVPAEVIEELRALQIEHGVDSEAPRAFLITIAKRCR